MRGTRGETHARDTYSLQDEQEVMSDLHEVLTRRFKSSEQIRVLDAGCGKQTHLKPPIPAHVVGLDASADALEQNPDLDERIVGDLQTYPLERGAHDLVICWDVLEHLETPDTAIANLVQTLKPGGLVLLKVPNVLSIKGLVTRWTPTWFHRIVNKQLLRSLPGDYQPFKAFHRRSIAPQSLCQQLSGRGLDITYVGFYEADVQRRLRRLLHLEGFSWRFLKKVSRVTCVAVEATEFVVVGQLAQRGLEHEV